LSRPFANSPKLQSENAYRLQKLFRDLLSRYFTKHPITGNTHPQTLAEIDGLAESRAQARVVGVQSPIRRRPSHWRNFTLEAAFGELEARDDTPLACRTSRRLGTFDDPAIFSCVSGCGIGLGVDLRQLCGSDAAVMIPPFAARLQRDAEVTAGWEPLPYNRQVGP
jgi:hypothetical protein